MFWHAVYAACTRLALPFVLGYFAWRGRREPAYRDHWHERLGRPDIQQGSPVWIHAASVGEVMLAVPLIQALRAETHAAILLTTVTPTGRAEARRRLADTVELAYLPLDTPGAVHRFVERVSPRLGVFVETELWPNLCAALARKGCPLALVNASVSARSATAYARWPVQRLIGPLLARLAWLGAATPSDAERFIALGAPAERVTITGNLKYDFDWPAELVPRAEALRREWQAEERPVWLAASTHDDEEHRLIPVFRRLKAETPTLLWVVAPRHPPRASQVAGQLRQAGLNVAGRAAGDSVGPATDVVLVDTLGELKLFYQLADMAFVGGSLVPDIGGHNVLEAAAGDCVFATGPYAEDWHEPMTRLSAEGAVMAHDLDALGDRLSAWLAAPEARRAAAADNARCAADGRGALARSVAGIEALYDAHSARY